MTPERTRAARLCRRADRRAARRWYDALRANNDDHDRAYDLWTEAENTATRLGMIAAARRHDLPLLAVAPAVAHAIADPYRT